MKKIIYLLGTLLSLGLAFSIPVQAASLALIFKDVNSTNKYFHAIEFLKENNIVSGYSDGTFQPERILNRAEMLKILIEAVYDDEFKPFEDQECFRDVPANHWFTSYICFAKEKGFVSGYSDGTFKPAAEINIVEALKLSLEVFNYNYAQEEIWYKGIVDREAAAYNFIPLGLTGFDAKLSRARMADLITRISKYRSQELQEYLDISKQNDKIADYSTLESGLPYREISNTSVIINSISDLVAYAEDNCAYYEINDFEEFPSVTCMVQITNANENPDDYLYFGGGLLRVGAEVLSYKPVSGQSSSSNLVRSKTVSQLSSNYPAINSEERALHFAALATGGTIFKSEEALLNEYESDEFTYNGPFPVITKSVEYGYDVTLFHNSTFGCLTFPLYAVQYFVHFNEISGTNIVMEMERMKIGQRDSQMCVD